MPIRGETDDERLRLALAYPFPAPDHAYVYDGGAVHRLDGAPETTGRHPVIACGSNRSPEQLHRKFGHLGNAATIPVQRAWLADFDIVYAAHITAYGSIAATLQHVAGTVVQVSVTWLSEPQLDVMHATESRGRNYDYARLDGLAIELDCGRRLDRAFAYVNRFGGLVHDGAPVGVREAAARNRPHPAMTQPEIQAAVHRRVAPERDFRAFVLENAGDAKLRQARARALQADAIPFAWPAISVI